MAVDRQRLDEVLEEARSLLEELLADIRGDIGATMRQAQTNHQRYLRFRAELEETERRISQYEAERSELPDRAYRAGLDQQYEEEDRLQERYRNLKPVLQSLEERREALLEEIREICPKQSIPGGHPLDIVLAQQPAVADAIGAGLTELEAIEARFVLGPVVEGIKDLSGRTDRLRYQMQEWQNEVSGDAARHKLERNTREARERLRVG